MITAAETCIENILEILLGNALAGIGKVHSHKVVSQAGRDIQRAARRGVPKGIDGEIQDDLLQAVGVAFDFFIVNFQIDCQFDAWPARPEAE